MMKVQLSSNKKSEIVMRNQSQGDAGTFISYTCISTTYRMDRTAEDDVITLADYFQDQISLARTIKNIEIHSTEDHYLIKVTYLKGEKWTSFDDMKASILSDEYFLDDETGIRISAEDILFEYEMEVHQIPYHQGEPVPFGGALR
ncbi:hypothetical protein [Sporosarcina sp. JAI121]|uniref:hypothetical protein n=1 Tax=Sporosarcina sp. JAI121 TaxID=2723064 RepID=UPI0015C79403|nr:hypothetical protein [Sporosarcina sp. JAI121]NYF23566.1 hypothetical protein [Sporosarcina sp. JAI121]